ncbi:MAG: Mrp/NBP35 family ATP-binding protein [Ruminococcaceae bacterium]|nr:Mrp/NBP35 family ATP-binding protein [Oscillospiraceae bacterium]
MSEGCSGNCASCSKDCSSKEKQSLLVPTGEYNDIKHVVAVVSGKGGVGKSMVTSLLAVTLAKRGYKVGILDADITGPSIPKAFGVTARALQGELGIMPAETKLGIKVISVNMMLSQNDAPVIWRGPVIAGAVKQFWQDVVWGELDYLLVDCPPGTGDVPLTVFQMLPLDGAVVVTSPQDLVSLIVKKALNMANMMNIPVYGIVENMSFVRCPDCGKEFPVFGTGGEDIAKETGTKLLSRMPIDVSLSQMVDNGSIEHFDGDYLSATADVIENKKG